MVETDGCRNLRSGLTFAYCCRIQGNQNCVGDLPHGAAPFRQCIAVPVVVLDGVGRQPDQEFLIFRIRINRKPPSSSIGAGPPKGPAGHLSADDRNVARCEVVNVLREVHQNLVRLGGHRKVFTLRGQGGHQPLAFHLRRARQSGMECDGRREHQGGRQPAHRRSGPQELETPAAPTARTAPRGPRRSGIRTRRAIRPLVVRWPAGFPPEPPTDRERNHRAGGLRGRHGAVRIVVPVPVARTPVLPRPAARSAGPIAPAALRLGKDQAEARFRNGFLRLASFQGRDSTPNETGGEILLGEDV